MRCLDSFAFRVLRVAHPFVAGFPRLKGYRSIILPDGGRRPKTERGDRRTIPRVELVAHPANCSQLVIIYPGLAASVDAESRQYTQCHPDRYRRLAERLQSARAAAVIRVANPPCGYYGDGQVAMDRLRRAIDFALRHARALCGNRCPEVGLVGFSAGAGVAAALASEYRPGRLVLVAPSGDVGPRHILTGLKDYSGRLVLLVGDKDEVVGRDAATLFDEISPAARQKEVFFVPDCDHFFTRQDHNRLLEETVLHTFDRPELV